MNLTHYLYSYRLSDNSQSRESFYAELTSNSDDTLWLGTNYRTVKDGDWLWISLTKPESEIVAVAEAIGEPYEVPHSDGQWQVAVRWMPDLTSRLLKKPLSFDVPRQSKQGSPQRVIPELERVLTHWLKGNYSVKARKHDEEVQRVLRQVYQRQGQQQFRNKLIQAYGAKCLVTGAAVVETLQAAHIQPVAKDGTHDPSNGLLLRADIHTLFDLHLITIDRDYKIHVSPQITEKEYRKLHGKKLKLDTSRSSPSRTLLHRHHQRTFL